MNEKYLGIFTIAFVSLIFIAFFATEINKPSMQASEITGMATATSGEGPCWQDGSTGEKVYNWYRKLAAASIANGGDANTLAKILNDAKYDNLNDLMTDISSNDAKTRQNAQNTLDKITAQIQGVNKFNFDFSQCKISCNNEKNDALTCTQPNGQRKDKMYKWIGDGSTETRQSLIDPNRLIIKLFGQITKNNVIAKEPNLAAIVANREMMTATCYCAEIELGCCEEAGGLSFKNQGPLQAQWKRNPVLDTYQSDVCPSPNKWIPGVFPTKDPNRRPGAPQLGF